MPQSRLCACLEAILGHMNVWGLPGVGREVGRRQENICEIPWAELSQDGSEGKTAGTTVWTEWLLQSRSLMKTKRCPSKDSRVVWLEGSRPQLTRGGFRSEAEMSEAILQLQGWQSMTCLLAGPLDMWGEESGCPQGSGGLLIPSIKK